MEVKIKRLDPSLPLPKYHTAGSAAFDFYARETTVVPARGLALIPSNLIVATPKGYMLMVAARSSLAYKKGLLLPNGVGIIDNDYAGNSDEILISVYNFTDQPVTVEKGDRIAQGIFLKIARARWKERAKISAKNRGGFGSTGHQL